MAAQGVSFESVYSAATWTLPSHATMLTGLLPHRHLADDSPTLGGLRPIRADAKPVAAWFKDAGYATAGFYNAPYLDPSLGFGKGFDTYTKTKRFTVFAEAARWALASKAPFFLFVHTYRVHAYGGGLEPADAAACALGAKNYDDAVRAVDADIGAFLSELEKSGALDGAVVAVTSDHGEELCDQGRGFGHYKLPYEEQVHVPFVLRAPGQKPRKEPGVMSGVDVAPTLAAAAGIAIPPGLDGAPRLGPTAGLKGPVVIEASDWAAMKSADAALVVTPDGKERSLGAGKPPLDWAPKLDGYLEILFRRPETELVPNELMRENLKAAGYLD